MVGLGSIVSRPATVGNLKEAIGRAVRREGQKEPMTEESWIRVSSVSSLCPREEVLSARLKITRPDIVNEDSGITFAHGTALHRKSVV